MTDPGPLTIGVVVPSAGRPKELARCLAALDSQSRAPDAVTLVLPTWDRETRAALAASNIRLCPTITDAGAGGFLSALRVGIANTETSAIAFVDDDAIPEERWLQKLADVLEARPDVGGVGGRILNFVGARSTARRFDEGPVARISYYGRLKSHLHDIPASRMVEEVDFLPGSNMCFRRPIAMEISHDLDRGMAPGNEFEFAMTTRAMGYVVHFDSDIVVCHYPADRPAGTQRGDRVVYTAEYSYVFSYVLAKHLQGPRRLISLLYLILVGQRDSPGLLLAPLFWKRGGDSWRRFRKGITGKRAGILDARKAVSEAEHHRVG